ncbi:Prostatic acid phosphatase [Hypsibius exemplaris]|uniref:acid phosphatase n=1 Tax=Hypsibius exemplaris TaxID=2072580 RepID=A0A1W0X5X9_HYPEX|nr:Prostatic acid phosphatase [Hypsibius exemplaris]
MNLPSAAITPTFSLFFTVFLACKAYAVEVVDDLKLVQLIFRHGDRAPLHAYKNDPYPESMWENGMGRLTKIGMEQQFEAGKFYRQRYSKFLDPSYGPNQVYIRSSDTDRTLESAEAFAAGLFPPTPETEWNGDLGKSWRPVSIHTIPLDEENLLSKKTACPAFFRLAKEAVDLPEARRLYKKYRAVFEYVVKGSGLSAPDRAAAWNVTFHVHDVIYCQRAHGKPLPVWMNESVYTDIAFLSDSFFQLQFGANKDKPRARLAGGNFLALLLKQMQDAVRSNVTAADKDRTKAFIYSAHDSTVAGILATLELYNGYNKSTGFIGIPQYTSTVLIELFKNNTVRISFKNTLKEIASLEPQVLQHANCGIFCPFDKLVEITKDYVVKDWDKECHTGEFGEGIDVDDVEIALITVILVIILTTFALGCYKRRSQKKSPLLGNVSRPESGLSVTYSRLDQEDASV